jgi:hypothetical protein
MVLCALAGLSAFGSHFSSSSSCLFSFNTSHSFSSIHSVSLFPSAFSTLSLEILFPSPLSSSQFLAPLSPILPLKSPPKSIQSSLFFFHCVFDTSSSLYCSLSLFSTIYCSSFFFSIFWSLFFNPQFQPCYYSPIALLFSFSLFAP